MATFYLKGLEVALKAVTGVTAAPTGTLKVAFMATAYSPAPTTEQFWSDISTNIASGTTVQTLAGTAVNIDIPNTRVEIDSDDITETPVTTSTDKYVIYMDTGVDATSPLIACIDIATTLSPVGGDLTVVVNAEGHAAINAS